MRRIGRDKEGRGEERREKIRVRGGRDRVKGVGK